MAKPTRKQNRIRQEVLEGLIETRPVSWEKKDLAKDEAGKEIVKTSKVQHQALRFPLAQNMSEDNVERLSRRWLK